MVLWFNRLQPSPPPPSDAIDPDIPLPTVCRADTVGSASPTMPAPSEATHPGGGTPVNSLLTNAA
jgi:hypothetical protein